jgi:tetratricopeptide (TPR) repeat protein
LAQTLDDGGNQRELRELLARSGLAWERVLSSLAATTLALALRPVPVPFDVGWGEDRGRLRRMAAATNVQDEPVQGLLLTRALRVAGDDDLAEALLREALLSRPREVPLHYALGQLLAEQQRWREAVECYGTARALRPDLGEALADALLQSSRVKEGLALDERLTVERRDNPWLHFRRGQALSGQGKYKEAEAAYREAIRVKPDDPEAHNNLGAALRDQGKFKEAEAASRQAIRLKPDFPGAHYNLGVILRDQGKHKEAEAAFRQAIRLKHDYPKAHLNLGTALLVQGKAKEAEEAYREAIRLKHDFPEAHCNLGLALATQGRFADALEAFREGHTLGSKRLTWRHPSEQWIGQCERLLELDRLLPAVVKGKAEPATPVEALELAALCQHPARRLHVTAVRLSAAAFGAEPKLAGDLQRQHRSNGACSATLAAAGLAEDVNELPGAARTKLRQQALDWLRADLALHAKMAKSDDPRDKAAVRQALAHWRQDANLASLRDREALARLPEFEREKWRQLWAEVQALWKAAAPGGEWLEQHAEAP